MAGPNALTDALYDEVDWVTLNWIVATPATTIEGLKAKALACAALNREMYDDSPDERDSGSPLLASLLRDMVTPVRNAILARCEAKYGPLPPGYTPDWMWVGRPEGDCAPVPLAVLRQAGQQQVVVAPKPVGE